ncbi:hypothetical protein QZH41_010421, partial [Actinostola sp. cb2023]
DFFPIFEQHNSDPNKNCPLHESHDVFIQQEMNKIEEYQSRWKCNYCGKLFYGEHFLDKHLDSRHQDHLVKDSPVCLADYCDVFRCDFLLNYRRDTFWEKALCSEEKMSLLRRQCEVLIRSCLPNGILLNETEYFIYESTQTNICSLLTCKDYWKPTHEEVSTPVWKVIIYSVFTPFFVMALIIYYYSAWEYYYGDLFQDHGSEMEKHSPRYVRSWQREGSGQWKLPTSGIPVEAANQWNSSGSCQPVEFQWKLPTSGIPVEAANQWNSSGSCQPVEFQWKLPTSGIPVEAANQWNSSGSCQPVEFQWKLPTSGIPVEAANQWNSSGSYQPVEFQWKLPTSGIPVEAANQWNSSGSCQPVEFQWKLPTSGIPVEAANQWNSSGSCQPVEFQWKLPTSGIPLSVKMNVATYGFF